jgi:hypothetical protein
MSGKKYNTYLLNNYRNLFFNNITTIIGSGNKLILGHKYKIIKSHQLTLKKKININLLQNFSIVNISKKLSKQQHSISTVSRNNYYSKFTNNILLLNSKNKHNKYKILRNNQPIFKILTLNKLTQKLYNSRKNYLNKTYNTIISTQTKINNSQVIIKNYNNVLFINNFKNL